MHTEDVKKYVDAAPKDIKIKGLSIKQIIQKGFNFTINNPEYTLQDILMIMKYYPKVYIIALRDYEKEITKEMLVDIVAAMNSYEKREDIRKLVSMKIERSNIGK